MVRAVAAEVAELLGVSKFNAVVTAAAPEMPAADGVNGCEIVTVA